MIEPNGTQVPVTPQTQETPAKPTRGRKLRRTPEQKKKGHIRIQPNLKMNRILTLEVAGKMQKEIAELLGISKAAVKDITASPPYIAMRTRYWEKVEEAMIAKQVQNAIALDPVEQKLRDLAPRAVNVKEELLDGAESEIVRNSVASDILDRTGYVSKEKKVKRTIEITEDMAARFAKIADMNLDNVGSIKLTEETSSYE